MAKDKILIVEDDANLLATLKYNLRKMATMSSRRLTVMRPWRLPAVVRRSGAKANEGGRKHWLLSSILFVPFPKKPAATPGKPGLTPGNLTHNLSVGIPQMHSQTQSIIVVFTKAVAWWQRLTGHKGWSP